MIDILLYVALDGFMLLNQIINEIKEIKDFSLPQPTIT